MLLEAEKVSRAQEDAYALMRRFLRELDDEGREEKQDQETKEVGQDLFS